MNNTVTLETIAGILTAQNFSMPAGYVTDDDDNKLMVRVGDKLPDEKSLETLALCRQIIYRLTEQIEDTSEALVSYRHRNGAAQIHRIRSADQSIGRTHRNAPYCAVAYMLRDLDRQRQYQKRA